MLSSGSQRALFSPSQSPAAALFPAVEKLRPNAFALDSLPILWPGTDPANSAQSDCDLVSTVTVTARAAPVTVTVKNAASLKGTSKSTHPKSQAVSTDFKATLQSTSFTTSTRIVSVSTSQPTDKDQYSFINDHGTTSWIDGKVPATTASIATSTIVVTVRPQPKSTTLSSKTSKISTSFTTLFTTIYQTVDHTEVLTLGYSTAPSFSSWISAYSLNGWNVSLTSSKVEAVGDVTSSAYWTNTTVYPTVSALSGNTPSNYAKLTERIHARQVGAVITATINGLAVSWTNSYGGEPETTPTSKPAVSIASVESLGPPGKSILGFINAADSQSTAPRSVVSTYPWDLSDYSSSLPRTSRTTLTLSPTQQTSVVAPATDTLIPLSSIATSKSKVAPTLSFSNTTHSVSVSASSASSSCTDTARFEINVRP